MLLFNRLEDLNNLRAIKGDQHRIVGKGVYEFDGTSWLPEAEIAKEAGEPLPSVAPSRSDPVQPQSTGYREKKDSTVTDMTPTIGKLDIDVNKGAGVDPAIAALISRPGYGSDGNGFGGGMNGIFGLAALGLVFGRGGGLFGNGDGSGAAAAMAAGETKEAIYNSSLSNINATHAGQLSALQSAATTNLAIAGSANETQEAICDVKAAVANTAALISGAVAQVGLENCKQHGDLSTQAAIANGTARTEAVASEARLSTTVLQGQNALSASLMSGFNNVERGQDNINQNILLQGCQTREAIKDCCCETQKGILATQNQITLSELRLTQATRDSTAAILDKLNADKISDLQDQLNQARLDASQNSQTLAIENAIKAVQASQPSVEVIVNNVVTNLLRFLPSSSTFAKAA